MYLRLTPGGHDSAPTAHKHGSSQKSIQQQHRSAECNYTMCTCECRSHTCVLYSPGLCERGIWRNRLAFANRHIFNKRHGWRVDVGTFKVIICTYSSLQVPVPTQKQRACVMKADDIKSTSRIYLDFLGKYNISVVCPGLTLATQHFPRCFSSLPIPRKTLQHPFFAKVLSQLRTCINF